MNLKSSGSPAFVIRPQQEADRSAVRRTVVEAFGEHGDGVADLVDALNAAQRTVLSLVAEVDGAVVGHVQLSQSWVDARERLVEVVVLSPLSVLPSHEKQGIGSALIAAAVQAAGDLGSPAVFLEGDPGFYGRRGFERASGRGFTRPSTRIPDPACQVVVLDAWEEWMTGALVYCDPFWAFDSVGLRDPLLAQLEAAFAESEPESPG